MRQIYSGCAIAVLLLAAGCSDDIKDTLGLNHHGPDEYQVLSRPSLTVPPEFSLRPPAEGPENPPGTSAMDQAHATVIGAAAASQKPGAATPATAPATGFLSVAPTAVGAVQTTSLPDPADSQLLNKAGADSADPSVRAKITQDEQNGVAAKDSQYLIDTKPSSDPLVDATKESERIKQDQQQNKPVTTGDTPVVAPQDKGLLGTIF